MEQIKMTIKLKFEMNKIVRRMTMKCKLYMIKQDIMTRPFRAPSDWYFYYVCSICTELEIYYYYYYYQINVINIVKSIFE